MLLFVRTIDNSAHQSELERVCVRVCVTREDQLIIRQQQVLQQKGVAKYEHEVTLLIHTLKLLRL